MTEFQPQSTGPILRKFIMQGSLLSSTWPFMIRVRFAWRILCGRPLYFLPLDFVVRENTDPAATQGPAQA